MSKLCLYLTSVVLAAAACFPARADVVFYRLPTKSGSVVVLEGSATVNPGGTVSFNHSKFGKIHFDIENVEIRKAPTLTSQFGRQLGRAGNDADKRMEAAQWALRHGLLPQFYDAVGKALEANPQHLRATLVKNLRQSMDVDLGDSMQQEKEMRELIGRSDMKFKRSKHFLLMHDTPDTFTRGKLTRADERLQLLETVYEAFLMRFFAYGVALEIPKERLKVVLFNEYKDYVLFAERLSPGLSSASGFWSGGHNTAIFYDHGTNDQFKVLAELSKILQARKQDAIRERTANAANTVRLADTISMLVEIERENSDITVVSHETTHQMAGNTGLLPRHVLIPSWVHEGLATYFETPNGANWSGVGAVNADRLEWYRMLEPDREHSNIDFIVGDQIFDFAGSHETKVAGYGQAWALTHFLLEKHFDEFMGFYRRLGEMPPHAHLSSEVITQLFNEEVKVKRNVLDLEWRSYMRSLKTDIEDILD
jgi:hypothetical protein